MILQKVLSISGKPGLYNLRTQTRGGFIAESIGDGKRISVDARHNVSMLSEIAIYTYSEEVPLAQVFQNILDKENGEKCLGHKISNEEAIAYFREILPDFDEDRVYPSNMKKVYQWYNILVGAGISKFVENKPEEANGEEKSDEEE